MWRDITGRFNQTNGDYKQVALEKLRTYKYQQDKPATENILRFNQINKRIQSLGIKVPDDLKITILLASLPASWEPFRQSFGHFCTLVYL